MSDFTYRLVRAVGLPAFLVSSRPVVLGRKRVPRKGAFILAPNHLSHYDVPCLMAVTPRNLDFMSVVEFLKFKWVALLFKGMNCLFLDRGRVDPATVRRAVTRLREGRALAMFPEGRIRTWNESLLQGNVFKPGVSRIAFLANAPVLPCVILGTFAYNRVKAWLPVRAVRYGVIYGELLYPKVDLPESQAAEQLSAQLLDAYQRLFDELTKALPAGVVYGEGHQPTDSGTLADSSTG